MEERNKKAEKEKLNEYLSIYFTQCTPKEINQLVKVIYKELKTFGLF